MSYEVHVTRKSDTGAEIEITLDEWNKFIESDPDFTPAPVGNINYGMNLFLLRSDSTNSDAWPWIAWSNGHIHSKYCEPAVLKKLGQMASVFGAVVMSDDGDIWDIDENGRVSIEGF